MIQSDRIGLLNGCAARMERYAPDGSYPLEQLQQLWWFIVQPFDSWFSATEAAHYTRFLYGNLVEEEGGWIYAVWVDQVPVAHAALFRSVDSLQIGSVGFVYTSPTHRGKGLGRLLMRRMMDDFCGAGGRHAILSTNNPTARSIYQGVGFREFNGHAMTFSLHPNNAPRFGQGTGREAASAAWIREGRWGDAARLAWLYASPSDWFIKDWPESLYDHQALTHQRCGSIGPAMMLNQEQRNGGLWVLEAERDDERWIVGAATMTRKDTIVLASSPAIDFFILPAYQSMAPELIRRVVESLKQDGARQAHCCTASCDEEKVRILREVGFGHNGSFPDVLAAGGDRYELEVLSLQL